jgi:hypothetical protein
MTGLFMTNRRTQQSVGTLRSVVVIYNELAVRFHFTLLAFHILIVYFILNTF